MCSGELAHSRNFHHPGDAGGQVRHETSELATLAGPYWTVACVHVFPPLPPPGR